jgi:uncharacterized protein (TIGR02452 family)
MSQRLKHIAAQTVDIVGSGGYPGVDLTDAFAAAINGTVHHLPTEALTPLGPVNHTPTIEVTHESTLAAAARLGDDSASLVFASARNPGGGFLNGAKAQEESLARASALYPCLLTQRPFYDHHRADPDLLYSDRVIYSPRVPVFRDDRGTLLPKPHFTSMLTAAAPNAGAILRNQPQSAPHIHPTLQTRAVRVLQVAAAHSHRALILGAWGCGVFRNDPSMVASSFATALTQVPYFDHVTFAILDALPGTPVHAAFAATLLP